MSLTPPLKFKCKSFAILFFNISLLKNTLLIMQLETLALIAFQ